MQQADFAFGSIEEAKIVAELMGLKSAQALKIISRFGGVPALVDALHSIGHEIRRETVYKWTYAATVRCKGGTGGIIPRPRRMSIEKAAYKLGIQLTNEDWSE